MLSPGNKIVNVFNEIIRGTESPSQKRKHLKSQERRSRSVAHGNPLASLEDLALEAEDELHPTTAPPKPDSHNVGKAKKVEDLNFKAYGIKNNVLQMNATAGSSRGFAKGSRNEWVDALRRSRDSQGRKISLTLRSSKALKAGDLKSIVQIPINAFDDLESPSKPAFAGGRKKEAGPINMSSLLNKRDYWDKVKAKKIKKLKKTISGGKLPEQR